MWLSDKILDILKEEPVAYEALKKFRKANKK